MTTRRSRTIALHVLLFLAAAAGSAHGGARALIGPAWSGPPDKLQGIVDAAYGAGRIDVRNDYLGARPGDPDHIVWLSAVWPILQVREIAGAGHRDQLGWYVDAGDGRRPAIDGRDDGPIFKNGRAGPSTTVLQPRVRGRSIGFYLRSDDLGGGLGPGILFTDRRFNDAGPAGAGALHEPLEGGDIQALVFDVSAWTRPNTWLVCFEDRDSGAMPGPCCATTDNDYADYVFEVRAEATTPNLAPSFGMLKRIYRD